MPLTRRRAKKESEEVKETSNDAVTQIQSEILEVNQTAHKHEKRKIWTSRRFLLVSSFSLGVIFCIIILRPYHSSLIFSLEQYELSRFSELDWARIEIEWDRLRGQIPEPWKFQDDGREFQVGEGLRNRGLQPVHPVVMIPGVITTHLVSWSTTPEYKSYFREKLWGGYNMITQVLLNREKWMAALMLDSETGLDPPGIRVRAAEGIDGASSFVYGYWIWDKIIQNLAALGYNADMFTVAGYDWRLSYYNLEVRDGYFSRLKSTIEEFKRRSGQKTVLLAHSMGSTVTLYFLKWVEADGFGNGGPRWVEDHIEAFFSVGGTFLGVPKAMSAFLSGEMKDTALLNPVASYILNRFFSRDERARLFRSWPGPASLMLKGGDAIWGNSTSAPDDRSDSNLSYGQLLSFRAEPGGYDPPSNLSTTAAYEFILEQSPAFFRKMIESNYSNGFERVEENLIKNDLDHRKWTNPLETRLPYAPSMKIYCVYGHGKETERGYWYTTGSFRQEALNYNNRDECHNETCGAPEELSNAKTYWIDTKIFGDDSHGVRIGEGDGTLSLLSEGAMCVEGWKRPQWNPANLSVITYEFPHDPQPNLPRGGATTAEHIDILGATGLNELVLTVAAGMGHEIESTFVSPVREYAAKIQWE